MDFKKISFICIVLFFMTLMSGCVNQGTTTEKTFENIDFESDVVVLDNANLAFIRDDEEFGSVRSVELKFFLHNPLTRAVKIYTNVTFLNVNGHELHFYESYTRILDPGDTETRHKYLAESPVSLEGSIARAVDHVRVIVYEVDWSYPLSSFFST